MKSIVLLLYSLTSSWACRESLFDHPLHCKFPIFFYFLNKRNLQKLFLLCVFPKSLKTCIRTWANVLLTSSDWSSIYQSSHWDTSQCQGVCGPFLSSVTNFFKQDIGSMCNMPDVKQNLPIQGAWAQVNKKPQMLDV